MVYTSKHLEENEQIILGSFYTPEPLVDIVYKYIKPYVDNKTVICDPAAGMGAFLLKNKECDYRGCEFDKKAYDFLINNLEPKNIFLTNSLLNVSRDKFNIGKDRKLIIIGNPPYNDITSRYRKNKKGKFEADKDIMSRDLGMSFLKSFMKLQADVVCVLHPLAYLIKKTNFSSLNSFKNNYRLKKAIIFSSRLFDGTKGKTGFPIMIGLYLRDKRGMDFEYIKKFEFSILKTKKNFILNNFETTDGYIKKYPAGKHENKVSPINIYYYNFRDTNSVKRLASFIKGPNKNAIVVYPQDIHKYCYLNAYKYLFNPENMYIYGNLSPLVQKEYLENNAGFQKDVILYSFLTNKILRDLEEEYKLEAINFLRKKFPIEPYDLNDFNNHGVIEKIENRLSLYFKSLAVKQYNSENKEGFDGRLF